MSFRQARSMMLSITSGSTAAFRIVATAPGKSPSMFAENATGELGIGLQFARECPAVHDRHAQIEDDEARRVAAAQVAERRQAILGGRRRIAPEFENPLKHLPRLVVVLYDEDGG